MSDDKKNAIHFVIGPPCSGKSYYIKNTFPDASIIDLWDYQEAYPGLNIETVKKSYQDTMDALCEEIINTCKPIVLEHTMLRAIRRKPYIEAVKELTDRPIICHVMLPSLEKYRKYCEMRGVYCDIDGLLLLEIPETSEGFSEVLIVN